MADIGMLLDTSLLGHVIEHGRDIVLAHLLPIESPEFLFILVRAVLDVLATIGVSTRVAKPDVIPSSSCYKSRGNFRVVHSPAVSRIEDSVLQKDCRFSKLLGLSSETRDTPDSQNISIFSCDSVSFELESILNC
jgi:hypothetical protein